MVWRRNRDQSTRDYPAAGTSVTGNAGRFRRAKTAGARQAASEGQDWEDDHWRRIPKTAWFRGQG
ncbi:hypothetical protein [Streptomyces sp. STR69]|uniref:hypothetical protein n=1 Tax=Streptomyces sp. STR69 TaxID=1796942 RepID=UPI0021C69D33|nr:hypothetical protein [Streptomyces sp. STR69]